MTSIRSPHLCAVLGLWLVASPVGAQDPAAAKGPDKDLLAKLETLRECAADRKVARDDEAIRIIDDTVVPKLRGGAEGKDRQQIAKVLEACFVQGKLRAPTSARLYVAAAAALGYCGAEGAKVLKGVYENKRFPDRSDWVPLREHLLRNLGKTKDESVVKFLIDEARRSHEAALQAAAGEALGNYTESKEAVRKQIVGDLIVTWGEFSQLADLNNGVESQNARDRLAAFEAKWVATFKALTRQNHDKFRDWQSWYNKHKGQAW